MEPRAVLLLCLCVCGVLAKVDHAEVRGEHPNQEDIDSGECIPIPCDMGKPPKECKQLCDQRNYETICQPPADFCLCQHTVNGKKELVSPDEVMDQPLDSEKSKVVKKPQEPSRVIDQPQEPSKPQQHQASEVPEPQDQSGTDSDDGVVSFQIFTIFLPIKQYLYDSSVGDETVSPEPTADTLTVGYETVNVHDGRLFWDFRYILTGLLLLMIGLVVYELVMCTMQVYGSKLNLSVKCETPEIKVKPAFLESEKILNV